MIKLTVLILTMPKLTNLFTKMTKADNIVIIFSVDKADGNVEQADKIVNNNYKDDNIIIIDIGDKADSIVFKDHKTDKIMYNNDKADSTVLNVHKADIIFY